MVVLFDGYERKLALHRVASETGTLLFSILLCGWIAFTPTLSEAQTGSTDETRLSQGERGAARGVGNISFSVTLSNTSGRAFDDPVEGATRQATLNAVLIYLADVLNENTGAIIDLRLLGSPQATGGVPNSHDLLASAKTHYKDEVTFQNGLAYEHITTGIDPDSGVFDINLGVNFDDFIWNSGLEDPAPSEYDLYSALLHELTHALGVRSLSTAEGGSQLSNGCLPCWPITGTYGNWAWMTRRDDEGEIGPGTSSAIWWLDEGVASFGGASRGTSTNRLVWRGFNAIAEFGTKPRIYAGTSWEWNVTNDHWHSSIVGAVMRPTILPGERIRGYKAFEIGALRDLGYTNAALTTDPNTIYVDFTESLNGEGTQESLFNNLASAVGAANSNATLFIEPGGSSETFTASSVISKKMTLINSNPGGGVVRIGAASRQAETSASTGFITR